MKFYNQNRPIISYALPSTKLGFCGIAIALLSVLMKGISYIVSLIPQGYFITLEMLYQAVKFFNKSALILLIIAVLIYLVAVVTRLLMKHST